jgi:hypothetical protein
MLRPACLILTLLLCQAGSWAQSAPQAPAAAPTATPAPATTPAAPPEDQAAAPGSKEPAVKRTHIEDDNARIDELRIRGQTKRIVVQPKKGGAPSYEVVPLDATRDNSQRGARGAEGQSVWHFLSF